MKEPGLEVNKLLQLQFVDGDSARSYVTRVDDIRDKLIYIAWPTEGGVQASVRQGDLLSLSFTREDAVYALKVKVESAQTQPLPILIVQAVAPMQRTQRRENVRVRVNLPMELSGVVHSEGQAKPTPVLIKVNVLDFSGGGFSFQQKDPISLGTVFESRFTLPGNPDPFRVSAKVIRCTSEIDTRAQQSHRIGMMFLAMQEGIRARIIRFVFGAQNSTIRG